MFPVAANFDFSDLISVIPLDTYSLISICSAIVFVIIGILYFLGRESEKNEINHQIPELKHSKSFSSIDLGNKKRRLSFTEALGNTLNDIETDITSNINAVDNMVDQFVKNRFRSEMKMPTFLSLKTVNKGVKDVYKKYKQRKIYKQVKKKTKGGDGLASIFNTSKARNSLGVQQSASEDDSYHPIMKQSSSIVDFLELNPFESSDSIESKLKTLSFHGTFSWIPKDVLRVLADSAEVMTLSPNTVLYSAADDIDFLFIVVYGAIEGITESKMFLSDNDMESNIPEFDFKLRAGQGASCFSEILLLLENGSFNSVTTFKTGRLSSKVLKIKATHLQSLHSFFPGFVEEFILKTLTKMNQETLFAIWSLSNTSLMKNPDIYDCALANDSLRQTITKEVDDIFSKIDDIEWYEAKSKPGLIQVIAHELGDTLSVEELNRLVWIKVIDLKTKIKRKLKTSRAKNLTRMNLDSLPMSNINIMKFAPDSDIVESLDEASVLIILKGRVTQCTRQPKEADAVTTVTVLQQRAYKIKPLSSVCCNKTIGQFSLATASFSSKYVTKKLLLESDLHKNKYALVSSETEETVILSIPEEAYVRLLSAAPQILRKLQSRISSSILTREVREVENALKRTNATVGDTLLESGVKTTEVSVVVHGRLKMCRTLPNKARTSIYPGNKKIKGRRSTLSEAVFGKVTDKWFNRKTEDEHEEPLKLKVVTKQATKKDDLMVLRRGDTFGRFTLFTNSVNPLSVEAIRYTQILSVPNIVMQKVLFKNTNSVRQFGAKFGSFMEILLSRDEDEERHKLSDDSPRVFSVLPASFQANIDLFLHVIVEILSRMEIKAQVLNSSIVSQIIEKRKKEREKDTSLKRQASAIFGSYETINSEGEVLKDVSCCCAKGLKKKFTVDDENRVYSLINEVENENDLVFLVVDQRMCPRHKLNPSWWSQVCIRQSDTVLHIANALDKPDCTKLEEKLSNESIGRSLRRELVLLHFPISTQSVSTDPLSTLQYDEFTEPKNTAEWIKKRGNISQHHHIRVHLNSGVEEVVDVSYMNNYNVSHFKSDFRRFVRWILGKSIGLVLGGGGARGISHLVVLQVLENKGVPVDIIAGTSIGAFMGAIYAWKTEILKMYKTVFQYCDEMGSIWRKVFDLTFPVVAYLTGYSFNKGLIRIFEDRKIEDLWLPYFCMTTDLTDSCGIAHRNGSLWRYCRASMTLVNFIPPLCDVEIDPKDPSKKRVHYLADGGYVNNLPVDVMRTLTGDKNIVIAVDVQSDWSIEGDDYGESYSGFGHLFKLLNPFTTTPNVPTNTEIQTQLAFIASVRQGGVGFYKEDSDATTEEIFAKTTDGAVISSSKPEQQTRNYSELFEARRVEDTSHKRLRNMIDLFLHPPVEKFGTLEFGSRKEIIKASGKYTEAAIEQWLRTLKVAKKDEVSKLFGMS